MQDIAEAKDFLANKGVDVGSEWGQFEWSMFYDWFDDSYEAAASLEL